MDETKEQMDPVTYNAPDHTEKYANVVHVTSTLIDVTVHFGRQIRYQPGESGPFTAEFFQSITMSPVEVKYLAGLLIRKLQDYEQSYGTLPALRAPELPVTPPDASEDVIQ